MRRAQAINLPLSSTAGVIATAGGATQTGSTNDAVALFAAGSATGLGVAVTDSATLGTSIAITRAGIYQVSWGFNLGASATVIFGISLNVDAAGLTANPAFANAGTLAVNSSVAPAATTIACCQSIPVAVDRVRAGAPGGAVLRFLATDGSNAAPAGIVLASMWYRVQRVAELYS